MKKAVLLTGSRYWTPLDRERRRTREMGVVEFAIRSSVPAVLIHGAARGVDKMGAEIAACAGTSTILPFPYPSDLGKRGGPLRNLEMLAKLMEYQDQGFQISIRACHDDIEKSKGTGHMVKAGLKAHVPTWLFYPCPRCARDGCSYCINGVHVEQLGDQ